MKALILAAGYATRLYPLTKEYPKPLLQIAKIPIIDYNVFKLSKIRGINEILVITNNKFFDKFSSWREGIADKVNVPIKIINDGTLSENDRLGAVGDISFALKIADTSEDIIIAGGDNLFEEDFSEFMRFAFSKKPKATIGVYDINSRQLATKYGVVKADPEMKIIDFTEKPKEAQSTLIATCLYYIPSEKLGLFQEYLNSKNEKDAAGSFICWLSKKEVVYSFVFRKHWYDIGDLTAYQEADSVFTNIKKGEE